MELKEYQQNTLKRVKAYLEALNGWRTKNERVVAAAGKEAALDVPLKAWEEIGGKNYRSRKNGIGEPLPNFCLKIPTGGGKTLLAAHTVDLVNRSYLTAKDSGVDPVFATRQLLEIIPNPWIAHDMVNDVIGTLTRKNGLDMVSKNFVFIVQELVKRADMERNRLAEEVFDRLVNEKKLRFLLLKDDAGYRLPSKISMRKGARKLTREDNSPLQLSLFEQVAEECVNGEERSVAWYFEKQGQLLWWYRNLSRQDYRLQGWRKNGIYPDFIVSRTSPADKTDFDKVFVVESKGIHLKNDDTDYKKQVFKLCNKLAEEKSWTELGLEFPERKIVFELIYGDEWQKVLNRLLK